MKLKLFIITLIAISFAVTGLLGGCGGKKKNNADEPRDNTISIQIWDGDNTENIYWGTTTGGIEAGAGYDNDDNLIWLAVTREIDNGGLSTDTLYVLSGVTGGNDQRIKCYDYLEDYVNFDATSSKSNIAKLTHLTYHVWRTTSYNTTGESTINITTEDGRKTWFTVKVVNSVDDMPEFIPNPPA